MSNKVDHIVWHRYEDEPPKTSGEYLVSRYGFMYDTNISDFRIYQNKDFRYVDTALFLIDLNVWDNNKLGNIYAWADLPEPMHD